MLDIFVMASLVACGALCGWWLRGGLVAAEAEPADGRRMDVTLEQLRTIAEGVAENLGEHHTRIAEIHNQLQEAARSGPEEILNVVGQLIESNEEMQRQLHSAEARLQHQAAEIASRSEEARTDALTQLANRRAFDLALADSAKAFQESKSPTALVMVDVDHFKRFNDRYGHPAGDAVLRGVAGVLSEELHKTGVVCRYGGEEFAVVFPGKTARDVAESVEHCRSVITERTFEFEGTHFRITCSVGLAEFHQAGTPETLVARADEALYHSKKSGRNCGHWHDGRRVRPIADAWKKMPRASVNELGDDIDLEKTDFSAGISTQAVFVADVERRLAERRRSGTQLSVLLAKIDDYELYVSEHGEGAGRAVTRAATLLFKATMRDMDHVAEFNEGTLSLLLPGCNLDSAIQIAERLREAASRCRLPERRFPPGKFTFTIVVAEASADEDAADLLARVEDAVTTNCARGRNCTYAHDGDSCQLVGAAHVSLATDRPS